MKPIYLAATFMIANSANALSPETIQNFTKLNNKTPQFGATYHSNLTLEELANETMSLVWGDERLDGFCFGIDKADFKNASREFDFIAIDKYPVSWRSISRKYSDRIYKAAKSRLGLDYREAGKISSKFRADIDGTYFKGCEFSWEGSFGGGSSSIYISEDNSFSFGTISSWSE